MAKQEEIKPKESMNWLIHLHYVRCEFDACKSQIDRLNITSEYSRYLRGLIALRTDGDVEKALNCFNEIKSLNNATYVRAIARCLIISGRHTDVVNLIRETGLRHSPSDWQLWYTLGNAYLHLGNVAKAKEAFQHSVQTTNQIEPFICLSQCHSIEGDQKSAIFVLRRASEVSPDNVNLLIKLAMLLISNDMKNKGLERIMQVSAVSTTTTGNLTLSLAIGSSLHEIKQDLDTAMYYYRLSECSESPYIWNNMALCFAQRKKFVAAVSCLKKALYLNPLDSRINYNLGLLSMQLRQFASAFHFFKSSATTSSASEKIFSLLAICLENLDDELNAKQAHLTAVKASQSRSHVTPMPLLNFIVHLYNEDCEKHRDEMMELMMEFEQCWLRGKQNSIEFDEQVMKTATDIAQAINLSSHVAWTRDTSNVKTRRISAADVKASSTGGNEEKVDTESERRASLSDANQ